MNPLGNKILNTFSSLGGGVDRAVQGVGNFAGSFNRGLNRIGQSIGGLMPHRQASVAPSIPVGEEYQQHLKQVQDAENNIGSFKKGGEVKKTGNYKLHKGEFVLNPRLVALIKSGEGHKLKGYEQTYKTIPKKKYDRNSSLSYRERTGYYKTKIDGGGHTAGYKWAQKEKVSPKERKYKYGLNSPSFDEGVHEYKTKIKESALKNKIK